MVSSFEQRIIDDVEQYGWFGLSVAPRADSEDPQEWWTYTVGLSKSHGWPEFVVFGQTSDIALSILGVAIEECEKSGEIPQNGQRLETTLKDFDAVLVDGSAIPDSYFNSANWFARHSGGQKPSRLQLMWPDKAGKFPFDPDCDPEVRSMQTPMENE